MKDLISVALNREREARRLSRAAGRECARARIFRCVLCEKIRPDEQRREPDSEVCIMCVRAAGFNMEAN